MPALLPLLLACAHLGPFPTPRVRSGEAASFTLWHVPEDGQRLYVVLDMGAAGEQLWFFDTGYSHTTCDRAALDAQGVPVRPSLARTRGELGWVPLERARLPDFTLGGHEVRGLRCAVRDLPATSSIPEVQAMPVAGVIGANLLRAFVVEVDPALGVLRLHPRGGLELEPTFRARREHLVGQRLRVPLTLDGETTWPILDYGATGTYLDADALGLPLLDEREGLWRGTGGAVRRPIRTHGAQAVALGGVAGPPAQVVDHDSGPGLLGMNVLAHYRLVWDPRSRWVQVERVQPLPLPTLGEPSAEVQ